eukprot:Phypoly_transcript_16002.p1 GENE.Phypoly_transcript_16002~~Phypoly_transcript_16002.p1  ORF type:complete len:188 (+),score=13.72 Phypoly_transcript_16002:52-615(+)
MQRVWRNHKYKIIVGGLITYGASTAFMYQMRREKKSLEADILKEGDNPSNEKRKLVFDYLSTDYDSKVSWDEWMLGINKKRKRLLENCKGDVLEMSIGTGRNFSHYPQKNDGSPQIRSITGIDYSKEMLLEARQKAVETPYEVQLFNMSNESIEFKDSTFDTIVDTFGICSVHDPIKVSYNQLWYVH